MAQAILVLQLTHSGVWLGLTTATRYAPVLLLTPYAVVIVDRQTKRRLLLLTQSSLAGVSLVLGALVLSGAIRLWMVFAVALAFGTLTALDNPARLAFISEMVGERLIRNAVTLNSTLVNIGRAIGPIVAATLVRVVGVGWCLVANAASFGAVIASLLALNVSQLHPSAPVRRGPGQLRQGLAYARTVPEILAPLFLTTGNSTVQLAARPAMRGRMTALWSTAFVGSTPIGATIIGAIGGASARLALIVGAAACGAAAVTGFALLAHARAATGRMTRPRRRLNPNRRQ